MANGTINSTASPARRIGLIALVVLVLLVLLGTYLELRPQRIRVTVVQPTRETVSNSITTNGKIEPINGFQAHAEVAGTVKQVLVREGTPVQAGQLLVVLDDTHARSDLATALARLKTAQQHYAELVAGGSEAQRLQRRDDVQKSTTERDAAQRQLAVYERLAQRGAASNDEVSLAHDRLTRAQADLDQFKSAGRYAPIEKQRAASDIADAQAGVRLAQKSLNDCNVRAPFAGTVYLLPVRVGTYVAPGDTLAQVADMTKLQVRAFVDEPDLGHLAQGQAVQIRWDAFPNRVWQGRLTNLPSTVVSRGSRVVGEVVCSLDNSAHQLMPNVDVNLTIIANSREAALTVPREAVQQAGGRSFVYVVTGQRLARRYVQLGISNLTRVEILSGIREDDTIAVQSAGAVPMTDGVLVKVAENPA